MKAVYEGVTIYETPGDKRLPVSTPTLETSFHFEEDGKPVEEVDLSSKVVAWARLRCTKGYVKGQAEIQVKKEIALGTDIVYRRNTRVYELRQGDSMDLSLEFMPDQASGTGIDGYFVKLIFDGQEAQMESQYPPRLIVTKPVLEIIDLHFEQNGQRITQAKVDERVTAKAKIRCKKSHATGQAEIQVKRDIANGDDEIHNKATVQYELQENEEKELTLDFIP